MDWHVATRTYDNLITLLFILRTATNHANNLIIMDLVLLPLKLELFMQWNLPSNLFLNILLSHLNQLVFYSKVGLDIIEQILAWNLTVKSEVIFGAIFLFFMSTENQLLLNNTREFLFNFFNRFLKNFFIFLTFNLKLVFGLLEINLDLFKLF